LEGEFGFVGRACERDENRAALRGQKLERAFGEPSGAHAQGVASRRNFRDL
jgi:hypothetical protein